MSGVRLELQRIIAYEKGELNALEQVELFACLIRTGIVWELQGSYGRTAKELIEAGWISTAGEIADDIETRLEDLDS